MTALFGFKDMTMIRHFRLSGCLGNKDGNAAIEFGLAAPMFIVSLVLMLDVGLAVGDRMELDRNLRAGVQATMANMNDLDAVRDVILAAASEPDALTVAVERTCTCGGVAVSCVSWCTADEPPSVFVNMSAMQDFAGVMLPAMTLEAETHVQLR